MYEQQKRCKIKGNPPEIVVKDKDNKDVILKSKKDCRLLGANIGPDLTWGAHLSSGEEKPVIPGLRKQLGSIKYLSRELPPASRKIVTEGLLLSRIQYMLPVCGGTTWNHMKKVQVILNKAARNITGLGRMTKTIVLMRRCNWLTASEMVKYHSLVVMWKELRRRTPDYFTDKLNLDKDDKITLTPARLVMTAESFRCRTTNWWNTLPDSMRGQMSLPLFKKQLRTWLLDQRGDQNEDPGVD